MSPEEIAPTYPGLTLAAVYAALAYYHHESQLAYAAAEERVIVTRDTDFLRLDASGAVHAGIVYSPQSRQLGELVRGLVQVWELLEPREIRGRVEFL